MPYLLPAGRGELSVGLLAALAAEGLELLKIFPLSTTVVAKPTIKVFANLVQNPKPSPVQSTFVEAGSLAGS